MEDTKMGIVPTEAEKYEWSKLAQAAYRQDKNDIGHFFSGLAAMRSDASLNESTFTVIQNQTADWKRFGWWPNLQERVVL
jgi:hypothetical protein